MISKFIVFLVLIIFPLNIYSSVSEKIYRGELFKPKSVVLTLFKRSSVIKDMSALARQNLHETKEIYVMNVNDWSVF